MNKGEVSVCSIEDQKRELPWAKAGRSMWRIEYTVILQNYEAICCQDGTYMLSTLLYESMKDERWGNQK